MLKVKEKKDHNGYTKQEKRYRKMLVNIITFERQKIKKMQETRNWNRSRPQPDTQNYL